MLPSWIRSRNCRPRFVYFLAIETTSRRLASTSSFLACSASISPPDHLERVAQPLGVSCSSSDIALGCDLQVLLALWQVLADRPPALLALVLRIELPLDRVDLALHALHGFDLVLDLLDQPALDDFGELDVADASVRARPQRSIFRRSAISAVLPLVLRAGPRRASARPSPRRAGLRTASTCRSTSRFPVLELVLGQLIVRR